MARIFVPGEFLRFLVTGGIAALVNLVSRYFFSFATVYEIAVILAYLVGMTTAFVLSRLLVFGASGRPVRSEFVRFGIVNVFAAAQVWIISVGLLRVVFPLIDFSWHAEEVAHFVGVSAPIVTSYLGHRHFSFAAAAPAAEPPHSSGRGRDER